MSGAKAAELIRDRAQDEARSPAVIIERHEDIALLRLSRPPVNLLTQEMRQALWDAIAQVEADTEVNAIVLLGSGASFCTGFAPDSLVAQDAAPSLNALCDRISSCQKPVIASLHGATIEGGLALALAAHYRVMGRAARLGAPEISLGLVPTGGVTQLLPRLVGAGPALELLLSGRPVSGPQAAKLGLVDELAQKRTGEAAVAYAKRLVASGQGPRPTRDRTEGLRDGASYFKEIVARREKIREARLLAPARIIDCVEAALMLPYEAGLRREMVAREECFETEESKALRHAFFSERRAARLIGAEGAVPREVKTLGLVGTGTFALGIAIAALDHEIEVRLLGNSADQLVHDEQRINSVYTRAVQQGQLTSEQRDARLKALIATTQLNGLAEADLVLDATAGSIEARTRLLARIEEFLPDTTVLATVADRGFARIAQELAHPERFVGLHFFAPAQAVRVVELACGQGVDANALATAHGFVRGIGKVPVTLRARDGLIANVVQEAGWSAVDVLLLMGARPARIDEVMRSYGFPAGPCEVMDALGLNHMSGAVAQFLVGEGRKGKAVGSGFYDYLESGERDDSQTEAILADLRRQGGVPDLRLTDRDIFERIVLAEANAGARLLQAGTVEHPDDIDVVMMLAKGYPRYRGGPMQAADLMGLLHAEMRLKEFADQAPDIWEPATIWRELVKNGDNFEKLNLI
ncbi:enoyl-CoA hydratase-related protein [Celeribacter sp. PS-C1]|uniref:enoyl-CoA hydratase-related protein n=1 Tax=Celeribacter sp. PS-C1 TaxID=2820813 RepID=UPI001CA50E01|nr:enoyl-CoA hydratase-related protein [Celeribacter sp. PS-C1]MBW6417394.1 enoyl-CoA hydratase/isomerase family protein [Celeribacter sp. PS-C1]